jgi:hypothetical protein
VVDPSVQAPSLPRRSRRLFRRAAVISFISAATVPVIALPAVAASGVWSAGKGASTSTMLIGGNWRWVDIFN